jgi:hypothetical protein
MQQQVTAEQTLAAFTAHEIGHTLYYRMGGTEWDGDSGHRRFVFPSTAYYVAGLKGQAVGAPPVAPPFRIPALQA